MYPDSRHNGIATMEALSAAIHSFLWSDQWYGPDKLMTVCYAVYFVFMFPQFKCNCFLWLWTLYSWRQCSFNMYDLDVMVFRDIFVNHLMFMVPRFADLYNNCPTRCNTKQSIYYSASLLYMFRVSTTPIIKSTQNCNYSLRYWSYYLPPTWPS